MNSPPIAQNTQMATPINSLPLKTTQENTNDLDDPLIQNVLKEFEDEAHQQIQESLPQQNYQEPQQHQIIYEQPQQIQQSQKLQQSQELNYNKIQQKLIDIDFVKKAAIITIIVFLLQYNNIISIILSRLPESINSYVSGKEFILNILLMFIIFYSLMYFNLL